MLDQRPRLDATTAEGLARDHFGLTGTARPLASERDQNFLITSDDGRRAVLKIANESEERALLEAQQDALDHLAARVGITPRVVDATDGARLVDVVAAGRRHLAWMVTWVEGQPLGNANRRSPALYQNLGRQAGLLDAALADFNHPAIHRDFYWDLRNGRDAVRRHRERIVDLQMRAVVDQLAAAFDVHAAPLLDRLPRAAIHGDLNDYNVLIGDGHADDVESRGQQITGIVDFGDMVWSWRVADVAIALAYALLGGDDPLAVIAAVVRGYTEHVRLDADELAALYGLVVLRLCASVCIGADQRRREPDNAYLGISQSPIAALLPRLASIPFGLAHAVIRDAAGVASVPAHEHVADFLRRAELAPVIGFDLATEPSIVLDLSVASPLASGDARLNDEPHLTQRIFGLMRDADVRVAIGRYDEPRLLYVSPSFTLTARPTDEHRTIHIGLDLFAEEGTPVYAPLDGVVHAFAELDRPQDYGPVIILRHATDDGTPFFTLYGHLSRTSLEGLEVGHAIARGEQIAAFGTAVENGGWTPHLHLQVMTDLVGLGIEFPGVALPSQRDAWCALCPDPNLIARVPADRFPPLAREREETLIARRARIGGNLSIAYREPVRVVRGWMQYLYDDEGRCFIDAYNNVPHVGHCHPRVVAAATRQMSVLNANTRYLNDLLADYAERLASTLPPALDVCYFVNSASEANELALRLTRAATGARDMIVLDAAYHGNTTSLIDISPYKHAGPGGSGAPDWVHVAPLPDDYRGAYRRSTPDVGARYAAELSAMIDDLDASGRPLGAFIAETCPSVGGQLILPDRYLENVYDAVRRAAGLCIADEVQTGLGRMGTSFWAFEAHGVVPDIVVMGKPIGNGHPIGAVATTRAIADAFDNGMEYFSTFGGNTVSCAVGMAVLGVVRDEGLQEHARLVGERLIMGMQDLQSRYEIVGDVRGSGLFLGMELVRDRETLEPAGAEASFVANRMRERGVLLGTDGPYHNVVKIRPPMPFSAADAEVLLEELDRALAQVPSAEGRR